MKKNTKNKIVICFVLALVALSAFMAIDRVTDVYNEIRTAERETQLSELTTIHRVKYRFHHLYRGENKFALRQRESVPSASMRPTSSATLPTYAATPARSSSSSQSLSPSSAAPVVALREASDVVANSYGGGVVARENMPTVTASSHNRAMAMASTSALPVYAANMGLHTMSAKPTINADGRAVAPMAAPRRAGALPPPPVVDPDPEHQLGYEAPLGETILPLLILLLTYVCYRRKREQVMAKK